MKKGVDYIGVRVGAVIFNSENRVFLARRGKEARRRIGQMGISQAGPLSSVKPWSMPSFAR